MDWGSCIEHAAHELDDIVDGMGVIEFDGPGVVGNVCETAGEKRGGALDGSGGSACSVDMMDGP
jgi:hypothetical protein